MAPTLLGLWLFDDRLVVLLWPGVTVAADGLKKTSMSGRGEGGEH